MEAGVVRGQSRAAFGVPHCKVCPLFLGQSVPVVKTRHGYGLFCEVCDLGRKTIVVRPSARRPLEISVDPPAGADRSEEE